MLVFSDYNTFFLRSLITQSIRIPLVYILVETGGRKLSLMYCFSVRATQSCVTCLCGYLIPTPYAYWFLQDSVSITRAVGWLFSVHETFLQRARWKLRSSETRVFQTDKQHAHELTAIRWLQDKAVQSYIAASSSVACC